MGYNFYEEINEVLSSSRFDADDFNIQETIRGKFIIEYKYSDNNYSFIFKVPKEKEEVKAKNSNLAFIGGTEWVYVFEGSMTPGMYVDTEKFRYHSFNQVIKDLKEWTECLYNELEIWAANRTSIKSNNDDEYQQYYKSKVEEIKKQIDEEIDENEMFSTSEIEELNTKLDEIRNDYEKQLESIIKEKEVLKTELENLKKDFLKLKNALPIMSKKNWSKKLLNKTIEFFKDEKKRKITFILLKGADSMLKIWDKKIPGLEEGIKVAEEITNVK